MSRFSGLWLSPSRFSMTWGVWYYSVVLLLEEDVRKRSSFFIREKSQVQYIRVVFPFCSSCSPHCLPIPSVPQLDLSSLSLSSLGTSTIVKHDESCKINSVRLNIYKRSFFTHIANGMSFKSLVTKWGAWASKKPKILPVTYIEKYMDFFFFFYSAVSGRYPSEKKLPTNHLLDHITENDIL